MLKLLKFKDLQFSKASFPRCVKDFGIVTFVKELHPSKARPPIMATELPRGKVTKELQP